MIPVFAFVDMGDIGGWYAVDGRGWNLEDPDLYVGVCMEGV
jgi:hypothetical protein